MAILQRAGACVQYWKLLDNIIRIPLTAFMFAGHVAQ